MSVPSLGDVVRGYGANNHREVVGLVVGIGAPPYSLRVAFADARLCARGPKGNVVVGERPRSAVTAPAEWRGTEAEGEPHIHLWGCVDYVDPTTCEVLIPAGESNPLVPPPPVEPVPEAPAAAAAGK